jgi:hypothetical protein
VPYDVWPEGPYIGRDEVWQGSGATPESENEVISSMVLAVISTSGTSDIRGVLPQLQLEQFQHDELYHREIARLPVQRRLTHMALHFAKYAGNLAESAGDLERVQRVVTDVFVIGTSCANALNVRLAEALPDRPTSVEAYDLASFASALTINAGRMAAACEKLDHLEDFPFRTVIREAAVELVDRAICFSDAQAWDLERLVRERLAGVKQKMIFHDRL